MSNKRHLKGWKKDVADKRDYRYRTLYTRPVDELPESVDLRKDMSAVENQGHVGSCTANAAVGAMEFLKRDRLNRKVLCFTVRRDLSRLFVYYNTRMIEGTVDSDAGASIRNTIKSLANYGVCYSRSWPYMESKFDDKPDDDCYKEGEKYKVAAYYRVETMPEILNALAAGYPVAFGALLFDGFNTSARTGIVDSPVPGDVPIGAHAMLISGYNRPEKRLLVRNSWGPEWGLGGYCYMPFSYFSFGDLVDDFWVVKG
jgi:C1A family cysteine protease